MFPEPEATAVRVPWREVEPLPALNGSVEPVLATVDSLRTAWEDSLSRVSAEEFNEARQRNLRRHAIETGIIERLYDLDWGVTEALVAEGITIEVAEREGGISANTLQLIRDQLDALEYLVKAVRDDRALSVFFVRELHQLITRHQPTYEARDALGNRVEVPLPHGEWKTQANHVRRGDGTLLEYTPPEHVQSQMEALVELDRQMAAHHPVARAAWLHHRFIRIHPFADGNGRVARALTLLVLLQARFAPLVVDRRNRPDYIDCLDEANDGDLRPLVRLFAQLEIVALRTELEVPGLIRPASGSAVDIARAHIDRLRSVRASGEIVSTTTLGSEVAHRVMVHLQTVGQELARTFWALDEDSAVDIDMLPPVRQDPPRWFSVLVLTTLDQALRYVVSVQPVRATSVLRLEVAATAFPLNEAGGESRLVLHPGPTDTVTLVASDSLEPRWREIAELLDRTLAVAIDEFAKGLA